MKSVTNQNLKVRANSLHCSPYRRMPNNNIITNISSESGEARLELATQLHVALKIELVDNS